MAQARAVQSRCTCYGARDSKGINLTKEHNQYPVTYLKQGAILNSDHYKGSTIQSADYRLDSSTLRLLKQRNLYSRKLVFFTSCISIIATGNPSRVDMKTIIDDTRPFLFYDESSLLTRSTWTCLLRSHLCRLAFMKLKPGISQINLRGLRGRSCESLQLDNKRYSERMFANEDVLIESTTGDPNIKRFWLQWCKD